MHVVFICNQWPSASGGLIASVVSILARGLAERGHRVTVIGANGVEGDPDPAWRRLAVEQPTWSWLRPFASAHELRRRRIHRELRRLHGRGGIDIVEWSDAEAMFWRPIPGVTDVLRHYGPQAAGPRLEPASPSRDKLDFHGSRSIPNWLGFSQWRLNEWLRIAGARPVRAAVVYFPIDQQRFHPESDESRLDPNLVVYAGSYRPRNGVLTLLKAANQFLASIPSARLELYGGDSATALPSLASLSSEVRDRVRLTETLPPERWAEVLRRAAVLVRPSFLDSTGRAWTEAMASGVPVVASRAGCGPEIVTHGVTGLLADPTQAATVAEAVEQLLRNPQERQRLGTAGRAVVERRFSVETALLRTVAFYEACRTNAPLPAELQQPPISAEPA